MRFAQIAMRFAQIAMRYTQIAMRYAQHLTGSRRPRLLGARYASEKHKNPLFSRLLQA